jgi:L-aminopeptidase/D-esterase-like protein
VRNLLTDVPGILVGNAHDARAATGVTVAVFEQSVVASVATLGGAPGDRAATMLEPGMTRGMIDAIVLSGGSLYGLDAAGGVTAVPPHFPMGGDPPVLTELGTVAADRLARAIARGVYEATALPYKTAVPDWKTRFGGGRR